MNGVTLCASTVAMATVLPTLVIALLGGVGGWAILFQLLVGFDNPTFENLDGEEISISMEQACWLASMVMMDDLVIEAKAEEVEEDYSDVILQDFGLEDWTRWSGTPKQHAQAAWDDLLWDNEDLKGWETCFKIN